MYFFAVTKVFSVITDKITFGKATLKKSEKNEIQLSAGTCDEVMWLWVSLGHFQPLMLQHLIPADPVKINRQNTQYKLIFSFFGLISMKLRNNRIYNIPFKDVKCKKFCYFATSQKDTQE